jgi:hypothetical protein
LDKRRNKLVLGNKINEEKIFNIIVKLASNKNVIRVVFEHKSVYML